MILTLSRATSRASGTPSLRSTRRRSPEATLISSASRRWSRRCWWMKEYGFPVSAATPQRPTRASAVSSCPSPSTGNSSRLQTERETAGVAMWSALITLILAASLAGCDVPGEHPALKQAALPPLIQAHRFAYHGAAHGGYQLSPDGRKLAWIGPSFIRNALFV